MEFLTKLFVTLIILGGPVSFIASVATLNPIYFVAYGSCLVAVGAVVFLTMAIYVVWVDN